MFPFKGPCCVVISGITNSGKTTFVKRLLENKNDMFDPKPLNVTYFYGQFQNTFNEMEQDMPFIQFEQGLPDQDKIIELSNPDTHSLFIIDDLMSDVVNNKEIENLFTKYSHHRNISVCYLTQNLYCQGKCARNINLNTQYMVLMRNPRDVNQIKLLSKQLGVGDLLVKAYNDVHTKPFQYLLVDLSAHTDDKYRIRTNIFPHEDPIIYKQ